MSKNRKVTNIQVFNTDNKTIDNYGDILPQPVCNERTWGPSIIHNHIAVMSNIQASIYPQVGIKSNMTQVIYIGGNGIYINSIITV